MRGEPHCKFLRGRDPILLSSVPPGAGPGPAGVLSVCTLKASPAPSLVLPVGRPRGLLLSRSNHSSDPAGFKDFLCIFLVSVDSSSKACVLFYAALTHVRCIGILFYAALSPVFFVKTQLLNLSQIYNIVPCL